VRACVCFYKYILSCGCKQLTYLGPCFGNVVARTRKVSCVFGYLNFCVCIHTGLCAGIYWFVCKLPEILSEPKTSCTSGYLIYDRRKFKDEHNHFLEYCVFLLKRLKAMEILCVNNSSAVSHNFTILRPHKPMCFEQVRALPHTHYTLGSW
jgi:hypothetical protein